MSSNQHTNNRPGNIFSQTTTSSSARTSTTTTYSVVRTQQTSTSQQSNVRSLAGRQLPGINYRSAIYQLPSNASISGNNPPRAKLSTDAVPFPYKPPYSSRPGPITPYSSGNSATTRTTPFSSNSLRTPSHTFPNRHSNSPLVTVSSSNLSNVPQTDPPKRSNSVGKSPEKTSKDFLNKVLKIKVKKTKDYKDDPKLYRIPVYSTRSKKRGSVLIINNITFVNEQYRKGAEIDDKNIRELFRQMNFTEKHYLNLNVAAMREKVKLFRDNKEIGRGDIAVIVFMSHGTGTDKSDSSEVIGVDGSTLSTSWIIEQFTSENCPHLSGKPKIFIFQCCRGDSKDLAYKRPTGIDSSGSTQHIRNYQDMLIAYSTVPGFVSHREVQLGTWYVQAICKNFMEYAHDTHVEDLFKLVDLELSSYRCASGSRQTTSYENRGFRTCYFNPKK